MVAVVAVIYRRVRGGVLWGLFECLYLGKLICDVGCIERRVKGLYEMNYARGCHSR